MWPALVVGVFEVEGFEIGGLDFSVRLGAGVYFLSGFLVSGGPSGRRVAAAGGAAISAKIKGKIGPLPPAGPQNLNLPM